MNIKDIIENIKKKFGDNEGTVQVPLIKGGKYFTARIEEDGICVENLSSQPFLSWQVFEETIKLLQLKGGKALKGDAMNSKLGDENLPVDSIEGHIALTIYNKKVNSSVFRRITPIACILIWADICVNEPGYLVLKNKFNNKNMKNEKILRENLIEKVIKNKSKIPYINLDNENKYVGWTKDFNLNLPNGQRMKLELKYERDLFLLFVLASCWSKTGQWENSVFFVSYLKYFHKDYPEYWINDENVESEKLNIITKLDGFVNGCIGIIPRKKISFRKDYYNSINILAKHWSIILDRLNDSNKTSRYKSFIDYISEIQGLGSGQNKMKIKIPLILRELRCQGIYENIPGKYCCVPDERVIKASKDIGISLPTITNIQSLLKASEIIYNNFGELYDIPLFAYEDLIEA